MNQKMVVSSSKSSSEAEQILRTVKGIIAEQKQFPQLDSKIEKLDTYFLVTLSPIDSIPLKHALFSRLHTTFGDIFTIENIVLENQKKVDVTHTVVKTKVAKKIPKTTVKAKVTSDKTIMNMQNDKRSFSVDLESEWYALLALALAGFMLIMRSNRQIGKIKKLQMELEEVQKKNDT